MHNKQMEKVALGVDIGGSHVSIGLYSIKERRLLTINDLHLDVSQTPEVILRQVAAITKTILNKNRQWKLTCAGIGCPGQSKNGVLVAASNLPTFKEAPLAKLLSSMLEDIDTILLNDADAAISAEFWGQSSENIATNAAMITLGTGIGFGLILNGKLHQGSNGLIEGGHMILSMDTNQTRCGCGQVGCVESYASARTTANRLFQLDLIDHANAPAIGSKEVFDRAELGDSNAIKIVNETAEYLAVMCINICRIVDPDVIYFAGGMSKAGESLLSKIRQHVQRRTWTVLETSVQLQLCHSAEHAGVTGAALAAVNEFKDKSSHSACANEAVPVLAHDSGPSFNKAFRLGLGLGLAGGCVAGGLWLCHHEKASSKSLLQHTAMLALQVAAMIGIYACR